MRAKLPPEVKAARRREYQQRYREQHREQLRVYGREYYHRVKEGEPKRKRGPKVGTKYRKEPPPETRTCTKCNRVLPVEMFYSRNGKRTHSTVCLDCRPVKVSKPKPPPKPKPAPPPKEKGCTKCWLYPCFDGIDNLETDFSLTCQSFKPR